MGYRRYVLDLAQQLGVAGYVKNEPDGSVTIFAQGEKVSLEKFLQKVKKPAPPAHVEGVRQKSERPRRKLTHFSIVFGKLAEELQEGFGAMETEFRDYRAEFKDYRTEFRDYRAEFKDYRKEFTGFASRTDENFNLLNSRYGEISEKLTHILETLQKESAETRKDLTRAIDTLSTLVNQYVSQQKGPQGQ